MTLEALAQKRIFFGHQSVGADILTGITELGGIDTHEVTTPHALTTAGITHARLGRNGDAESKLRDFERWVTHGIGDTADVALFKLCYVDVNRETDVARLFEKYDAALRGLAEKYPRTRFVHATVPLKAPPRGWRPMVKRLLGRSTPPFDNISRQQFNERLRAASSASGRLFDLAAVESTREDGTRSEVDSTPCLCADYTHDGGHLNAAGRRHVARQFLAFLASV